MLARRMRALCPSASRSAPAPRTGGGRPRHGRLRSRPASGRRARARRPPRRRSTPAPRPPARAAGGSPRPAAARRCRVRSSSRSVTTSAAISASSRCSSASSAAGATSTSSASSSERWVKVENHLQRVDLVPEQVDPHGPVLGCGEHVEQSPADRELPPVLDLLDALVAGGDERRGRSRRDPAARPFEREAVRAQRGVRDLLRQGDGAHDDHSVLAGEQRVERRDPQADEVRRAAPGATRR